MIPRKHLQTVALINRDRVLKARVRFYFHLRRGTLSVLLRRAGLGHADLVLCLLRLGELGYVERLIGKPIVYGPSFSIKRSSRSGHHAAVDTSPRITFVQADNPRQSQSDAYSRFKIFKVGRTESQLRARGVTRRDIRKAQRRGWIRMEATYHA